jgi:arginase
MSSILSFIINKSELGAGTRGASIGPEAIQVAARQQNSSLFAVYPTMVLPHQNDLLDHPTPHSFAKYIDGMQLVYEQVSAQVESTLKNGEFPFVLAGDHCSAGGTIAGIKKAFPMAKLGVVWIDAHADLHTPLTTPSGNLHGMPLATALGIENNEMAKNKVPFETLDRWNSLKSNFLLPENLVFVGVRDTEKEEDFILSTLQIKNFTVEEVSSIGIEKTIAEIQFRLKECDLIYVSFDVDSMDPDETSYGTGTPVKNGLSVSQAEALLLGLIDLPKTAVCEMVEINPCLDNKVNRMAEISFSLIKKISSLNRFQ